MRPWLIFGAGGSGVGALTAERALADKRQVIALIRNPQAVESLQQKGVTTIAGDACDAAAVASACSAAGKEALIISTLGGEHDYLANRTIIDAAEQAGISRMILVTSLGCGDSWIWLSPRARAAFGQAVREKSLAESWLQTSRLDFAILRPGGLLNTAETGQAKRIQHRECHGLVTRADVAAHIQALAAEPTLDRQIYSLVDPGLKPA